MRSAVAWLANEPDGLDSDQLAVPQAFLPDQYFERLGARTSDLPERRLMFAVLLDAVSQLQRPDSPGAGEVLRWMRCDEEWPCSFRNVCGALGIDADYLAKGLRAWCGKVRAGGRGIHPRQLRSSPRASRRNITLIRDRRRRRKGQRLTGRKPGLRRRGGRATAG